MVIVDELLSTQPSLSVCTLVNVTSAAETCCPTTPVRLILKCNDDVLGERHLESCYTELHHYSSEGTLFDPEKVNVTLMSDIWSVLWQDTVYLLLKPHVLYVRTEQRHHKYEKHPTIPAQNNYIWVTVT